MRGIVLYIYEDICKEMTLLVIKAVLNNDIVRMITNIEQNKFTLNNIKLPAITRNKLRKNSKKKSSYASNKIEGNPLTEKQVRDVIDKDEHKHFLKPEQEVRNYYMALNYLEEQIAKKAPFTKELILKVQSIVEKGASKEKIGLRGAMPPGYLFAVYDSETQEAEYIPPEYNEIPELLDELVEYVNTTDDHPLIIAAIVHYQIITIHAFEDNNGSTGGNNNQTTTDGNKGNNEGTKLSSDKIQEAVAAITTAKAGDTYTVDMSDATVAPKDVLEAAKGKDVDIVLDMNGYKWTINGNNIQADNLKDINLAVDTDSDAIPDDVISELAGNNPVKQISLAYSGDFGFKASLTYNIGSEYAGKYGNLYYYDSTGRMIFQNAGAIDADGNISLNFSHASEYAVVIADYAVTTENADNTATGGIATGDSTPIALYAVLCVMAIALAGIAAVTRKKNV